MYIYPLLILSLGLINTSVPQLQQSQVKLDAKRDIQIENVEYSSDSFSYFKETSLPVDFKFKADQAEKERLRIEENRLAQEQAEILRLQQVIVQQRVVKVQTVSTPQPQTVKIEGNFAGAIIDKCAAFGCNPEQLIRVMYCESGGRSNARNGIHSGLFQFNPNTFKANAARSGIPGADIWNPYNQIHVAAWMFAHGQAGQWSCK